MIGETLALNPIENYRWEGRIYIINSQNVQAFRQAIIEDEAWGSGHCYEVHVPVQRLCAARRESFHLALGAAFEIHKSLNDMLGDALKPQVVLWNCTIFTDLNIPTRPLPRHEGWVAMPMASLRVFGCQFRLPELGNLSFSAACKLQWVKRILHSDWWGLHHWTL